MLIIPTNGLANDTSPQWVVSEGDQFHFRLQLGFFPRLTDISERIMTEDEIVNIEITFLDNISSFIDWTPTNDRPLCWNQMHLENGSDLPNTGLFIHIRNGFWNFEHMGAMPVGNWSEATDLVLAKNGTLSLNASYEVVEDSSSWGYSYHIPDIDLTDTRIWSKTDGSLLSVNIVNGFSERMTINESLDVALERYEPNSISGYVLVGVIGAVVIIALVVFLLKRRT